MQEPSSKPKITPEQYQEWIEREPTSWARSIYNVNLWAKQEEIIKSVFTHRRTSVKGCVASSKSVCAAVITHAWLQRYTGSKVFLTAPSDRQVKNVLWAEVRALHTNAKVKLGGRMMPSDSQWTLAENWYALGFSTNDPNRFHGIHGGIYGARKKILFIIDESQGISQETFDAIENVMSDGLAHMLLLQNPAALTGEAHASFNSKRHLYNGITISAEDTPNYKARKIIIPGMITYDQVQEWAKTYGVNSNFYRVKALAQFPNQEPDSLIPMEWIELAMQREVPQVPAREIIGQDVAWEGDDDSVLARLIGRQVFELEVKHGRDPMEIADALDIHLVRPGAVGFVDAIGIGAGVYAREAQRKRLVHKVTVSENPVGKWEGKKAEDHFYNLRAQIGFILREALNPANPNAIALPKDLKLQAEMSAVKFFQDEKSGLTRLWLKKEMKKELGFSPDRFDAVALAVFGQWLIQGSDELANWAAKQETAMAHGSVQSETVKGLDLGEDETFSIAEGSEVLAGLEGISNI